MVVHLTNVLPLEIKYLSFLLISVTLFGGTMDDLFNNFADTLGASDGGPNVLDATYTGQNAFSNSGGFNLFGLGGGSGANAALGYNAPQTNYNAPQTNYNAPQTGYNSPQTNYNPAPAYNANYYNRVDIPLNTNGQLQQVFSELPIFNPISCCTVWKLY